MKPRLFDELIRSAVETACYATGQSTIEEAGEAYQEWLDEHDRQVKEQAWEEGYLQAITNLRPPYGATPAETTPNPYRKGRRP